jgi:DNA-binding CsgD family transcriptional regulator
MASQLSPRQREILDLVAEGRTSKEIAVALGISESTVNWHLANVFTRLGASSRAEAVALAMRSNGGDRVTSPVPPVATEPAGRVPRGAWPRLVAIAIAIAIAGALLGGATVATLRPAPVGTDQPSPTVTPPANGFDSSPSASPARIREDVVGGDVAPNTGAVDAGAASAAPATLVPVITAPPLPSLPLPLPVPVPSALPSAPITVPPAPSLPIPPLPVPTAIPSPSLPLP